MHHEMTAAGVLSILDMFARVHARLWIAGGWGIDTLVGEQTRPHADLDLIVDARDEQATIDQAQAAGFSMHDDLRPTRFVLHHPDGREIDMHPVIFEPDGNGRQLVPGGTDFHYPAHCFTTGTIGDRRVPCITAEQQVVFHLGYDPLEKDIADMRVLHTRRHIPLPAPYAHASDHDPTSDVPASTTREAPALD